MVFLFCTAPISALSGRDAWLGDVCRMRLGSKDVDFRLYDSPDMTFEIFPSVVLLSG
jgi:hypothetical protein